MARATQAETTEETRELPGERLQWAGVPWLVTPRDRLGAARREGRLSLTLRYLSWFHSGDIITLSPLQLLKPAQILLSSNIDWQNSIELTARFVWDREYQ